jgi:hypothetical protein
VRTLPALSLQSAFEKRHKFFTKFHSKSSSSKAFSNFKMTMCIKKKLKKIEEKFGRKIKALTFALPIQKGAQK